jgi:hypothetical protein
MQQLGKMRISLDEKGKLDFSQSQIRNIPAAKRAIKDIYTELKLSGTDGAVIRDGYDLHFL